MSSEKHITDNTSQYFCFGFLERTLDFQAASAGACWTGPVCVVTRDGPRSRPKVRAVSVHLPVKDIILS